MKTVAYATALIMSALQPGLGHIFVGNLRKGIALSLGYLFILCLATLFNAYYTFAGLLFISTFILMIYCLSLAEPILLLRRHLASPSFALHYIRAIGCWILFVAVSYAADATGLIRSDALVSYKITNSYMEPALFNGEYIFVDTHAYANTVPQLNDIVVLDDAFYNNSKYLFRIIGIEQKSATSANNSISIYKNTLNTNEQQGLNSPNNPTTLHDQQQTIILADFDNAQPNSTLKTPIKIPSTKIHAKALYIYYSYSFNRIGLKCN